MDVVGNEIGQKMRSAIKAKLTELGCYVDDELPDYVMVMVANKRTRAQMEDDLQLFLGDNTELFVNWLHQVLEKLQEVTVTTPIIEGEKSKEKEKSKDKNPKEKKVKEKTKKSNLKKSKKKEKEKLKTHLKKKEKKAHKKKKSKHDQIHRPNIPPLLMNIEKNSEPSITDVFAGQILKNHGILMDTPNEALKETKPEIKVFEQEPETVKKLLVPIIDPATIQSEPSHMDNITTLNDESSQEKVLPREEQLKEINEIEAKIKGLKQKLAEQLDSMSDDEDFLNIRTEAEELMNDFAEDVFQEISEQATSTPPIPTQPKSPVRPGSPEQTESPIQSQPPIQPQPLIQPQPPIQAKNPVLVPKSPIRLPIEGPKDPEALPHIELKLPKRSIRERLGIREEPKKLKEQEKVKERQEKNKKSESPERYTPERVPELRPSTKSAKSRLGDPPEPQRKHTPPRNHSPLRKHSTEKTEKLEPITKRLTSKVSVLENRNPRVSCASVVRVRPRPRVPGQASSLLLRAVADAQKSLLTIPPKIESEPTIKRALVLPMRRSEPQKIIIQVPANNYTQTYDIDTQDAISLGDPDSEDSKMGSDLEKDEYMPKSITKQFLNTDYTPFLSMSDQRTSTKKDDTLIIEAFNIHKPAVDKDKNTKFIVTMDGYHPNAFLAKKLKTEGILNDDDEPVKATKTPVVQDVEPKPAHIVLDLEKDIVPEIVTAIENHSPPGIDKTKYSPELSQKRIGDASEEGDTQVIIEKPEPGIPEKEILEIQEKTDKRKCAEPSKIQESPPAKRRKSSPIVFDVKSEKKETERERTRTESAGSDNQVIVTTTTSSHKYDSLPPLSTAERKPVWCRAFPQCRYGSSCAFQHPRCRFAAACTRRSCPYTHGALPPSATPLSPVPVIASHVVPSANFKTISSTPLPAMCKYYPSCSNPACHFYHPKPCRYGKTCTNKFDCNFYHAEVPSNKWRHPV